MEVNVVKNAINALANNKKDKTYDMTSNHFIYGTEKLFNFLSKFFGAVLIHGCCIRLFNKSTIKPIPKTKQKSCCDSTNYRAISLNSISQ